MGLSRSLSTGTSSLVAHQQRLDIISNNIANANTIGYKSSRATFADQFSQVYRYGKEPDSVQGEGVGGVDPMQFGLGVKMASITNDMSQGILETTNRPLDMALQGNGFFVYNLNGQQLYSRAGAVNRDQDGYFVDSNTGAYLKGYNVLTDATGKAVKDATGANIVNAKLENLRVSPDVISAPNQTQNINVSGNLNSAAATGDERKTSITVFDNNGGTKSIGLTFTKTANPNEWGVAADIDGNAVALSSATITFNDDGSLNTPLTLQVTAANLNTAIGSNAFDATTPKDITITLADANNLLGGLRQYAGSNTATTDKQDGYQAGYLNALSVDQEGKVWGAFTNGQSEVLGQVAVAQFANQSGLMKEGDNFFRTAPDSGLAIIGTAGEMFQSTKIASQTLEQSNVDLTTQFTDMISTQRAFEAAARTVTVSDQLLAETNMLKR
ncbi:MAG: flagellar hook protein FlgE [Bacteroidota bacterium]|nr:flagellar hook protein FlgE [Bacteroidota bacterium]